MYMKKILKLALISLLLLTFSACAVGERDDVQVQGNVSVQDYMDYQDLFCEKFINNDPDSRVIHLGEAIVSEPDIIFSDVVIEELLELDLPEEYSDKIKDMIVQMEEKKELVELFNEQGEICKITPEACPFSENIDEEKLEKWNQTQVQLYRLRQSLDSEIMSLHDEIYLMFQEDLGLDEFEYMCLGEEDFRNTFKNY